MRAGLGTSANSDPREPEAIAREGRGRKSRVVAETSPRSRKRAQGGSGLGGPRRARRSKVSADAEHPKSHSVVSGAISRTTRKVRSRAAEGRGRGPASAKGRALRGGLPRGPSSFTKRARGDAAAWSRQCAAGRRQRAVVQRRDAAVAASNTSSFKRPGQAPAANPIGRAPDRAPHRGGCMATDRGRRGRAAGPWSSHASSPQASEVGTEKTRRSDARAVDGRPGAPRRASRPWCRVDRPHPAQGS